MKYLYNNYVHASSERRTELLENNIKFALVSIGKPEIGLQLCKHLDIKDGEEWIFADPENDAYDNLSLNRGWDTMIRPATAFRFKDRIFGGKGESLDKLFDVLGKWKDGKLVLVCLAFTCPTEISALTCYFIAAIYVPPKIEQSTNHGGTFIFKGDAIIFAHYDESPGTHADTFESIDMAIKQCVN